MLNICCNNDSLNLMSQGCFCWPAIPCSSRIIRSFITGGCNWNKLFMIYVIMSTKISLQSDSTLVRYIEIVYDDNNVYNVSL